MVQIQILYADVCIVAHLTGCHLSLGILWNGSRTLQLHRSLTFAGCEISRIVRTVGFQRTVDGNAVGYAVVVHRLWGKHGCQETDVLCLGTQLQIGLQPLHICQVTGCAVSREMESGGQVDVEPCKLHALHVAVNRTLDGDGVIRIFAYERGRHITHEAHQVLLAQLRVQSHLHLTRIPLVKGVKVHIHLGVDVGIGCLENEGWYLYLTEGRIELHATFHLGDLQTAFFLETCVADIK